MAVAPKSIAIIIGSTRKPRACPEITDFVRKIVESSPALDTSAYTLNTIDLADWNLPLFDEPMVPSQVHTSSGYGQPHTRRWSEEISRHSAFIIVTPQYNWGYPAALKNAIDYLFNEWHNKPAMIVSYGGHGGGKCAAQLRQVLQGVDMRVAETMPALHFKGRGMLKQAAFGEPLNLMPEGDGVKGAWGEYCEVIRTAFEELLMLESAEIQTKS